MAAVEIERQQRIIRLLARQPDPMTIKHRKGPNGKMVAYLPIEVVLKNANEVFGLDWNFTIIKEPTADRLLSIPGGRMLIVCTVRVQVGNWCTRDGVGQFWCRPNEEQAVINARKASISEAIKGAMKLFGPYLGLHLDQQAELHELPPTPVKPPKPPMINLLPNTTAHQQQEEEERAKKMREAGFADFL